jgi:uncharacterized protein YndB with AHSA1/START domain
MVLIMGDVTIRSAGQLGSVERSVVAEPEGDVLHTVIRLSQSFPVRVDEAWDACTAPGRLSQWLGPVSGDLRPGGTWQLEGNASGTIESCNPPEQLRVSWEFDGYLSWVVMSFVEEGPERTTVTLEHIADATGEDWAVYGPGAGGVGWDLAFLGLANHLIYATVVAPESTTWVESEDARQFISESSRLWAEESIRAGTDSDAAKNAEALTTAAFLGEAEE